MKKSILIIAVILFGCSFREIKAQATMKYKDIYSLIKVGKTAEALPNLVAFLKEEPKHSNGDYWAGKIYYEKAISNKSVKQADSSILYFKQAIDHLTEMDVNPINVSRFPDFTGSDMAVKVDNGKKWMQNKITELESFKQQAQLEISKAQQKAKQDSINAVKNIEQEKAAAEKTKMQEVWASKNTGTNDPMIVAKKFLEALKSADIETYLKLIKKDSKVSLKLEALDEYKKDKAVFKENWQKEILKRFPNLHLTDNTQDLDFEEYYDKESKTWQAKLIESANGTQVSNLGDSYPAPIPFRIEYTSETQVTIHGFASYQGRKGNYTTYLHKSHRDMLLEKIDGKWMVVSF